MNDMRVKKRSASMACWFDKYVEGDPKVGHAWRSGLLGEDAWFDLVKSNYYPKWARSGNRRRLFKSNVKAYARKLRADRAALDVVVVPPPFPEGAAPIDSDHE